MLPTSGALPKPPPFENFSVESPLITIVVRLDSRLASERAVKLSKLSVVFWTVKEFPSDSFEVAEREAMLALHHPVLDDDILRELYDILEDTMGPVIVVDGLDVDM